MKLIPDRTGFDLDGVIADTAETFLRLACEKYGHCSFTREDITSFDLENCIAIEQSLVEKIFTDILEDSLSTGLTPMEGAVETLTMLAGVTEEITIITARSLEQPVLDWIDVFFPARTRDAIRVIATGDHDDKTRYIHDRKLQYFIDDRAETCMQLATAGITPVVFEQPWNRNRHNLRSVSGWHELSKLLTP
ncbi:5' nucleotidase, NT5C type [Desulfomarina sp.]